MTTPARARLPLSVWVVAVALPLIVMTVAVALQLAWLPQLPDPIAIHWGADGGPDGFGPAWSSIVLTGALGVGLTGMFAAFLLTARVPAPTATHKLLAAISLAESLFLGITVTASVGVQRGLDDARTAPELGGWLAVAFGVALVVATAAWFAMPKAVKVDAGMTEVTPMPLAPTERGVWIATARLSTGASIAILAAIGFALAAAVFAFAVSQGRVWPVLVVPVLLLAMTAVGFVWRVRIDAQGIRVASAPFGWPRVVIPVSEIARVETSHVEPMSEFGGYGWRWAPGRSFGVVTRRGEAIEVERHDGRRFTITVDDATTGASLLAAHVAKRTPAS